MCVSEAVSKISVMSSVDMEKCLVLMIASYWTILQNSVSLQNLNCISDYQLHLSQDVILDQEVQVAYVNSENNKLKHELNIMEQKYNVLLYYIGHILRTFASKSPSFKFPANVYDKFKSAETIVKKAEQDLTRLLSL
jgi:hypothetical protein